MDRRDFLKTILGGAAAVATGANAKRFDALVEMTEAPLRARDDYRLDYRVRECAWQVTCQRQMVDKSGRVDAWYFANLLDEKPTDKDIDLFFRAADKAFERAMKKNGLTQVKLEKPSSIRLESV